MSGVTPLLPWIGLGASFLIGLAAVIRMAGPAAGLDQTSGVIRLPREVTLTVLTLFALAAAIFLSHVVRRGWTKRPPGEDEAVASGVEQRRAPMWLRIVRQFVALGYFVLLAYLLSRGGLTLDALMALGVGSVGFGGGDGAGSIVPNAPPLVTWSFGILAIAAGAGALALAVWVALGVKRGQREEETEDSVPVPLAAAVDDSAEDLRTEPDARRAIVRSYARFERAAAEVGVPRPAASTPMEFMREALRRLPSAGNAVPALTRLFELARFSHHPMGSSERDRAIAALDEIRAAMRPTESDAR